VARRVFEQAHGRSHDSRTGWSIGSTTVATHRVHPRHVARPWACPQSRAAPHGYDWCALSGERNARMGEAADAVAQPFLRAAFGDLPPCEGSMRLAEWGMLVWERDFCPLALVVLVRWPPLVAAFFAMVVTPVGPNAPTTG
jgi:hypothetical protein